MKGLILDYHSDIILLNFLKNSGITSFDFTQFGNNFYKIISINGIFNQCKQLKNVDLRNWYQNEIVDMADCFEEVKLDSVVLPYVKD